MKLKLRKWKFRNIKHQKLNIKMQNDKEKFKKEFIGRLIKFTIKVIKLGEEIKTNRLMWSTIDQVIRSAGSIGANVVEAKASSSKKDYIKFFEIALKSANETIYWLMVIEETIDLEKKEKFATLKQEAIEIAKILGSSVLTLKNKK